MKKYIFMAVAGMLALSSCSNDDNEQTPQNAPRQMTFTAGFGDGTQTRTTLNADKSVSFDANDAISIFSENNNNVQFTTTAGGATADFTGTAVAGDATYYAVYPYKDSYTFSGGIVSGVTIDDYQPVNTIEGQTWSKSSVISYATTTGSDLEFHNACALLKITNNTGVGAEIKISADAGQSLAGTFDLNTSTGALTVTDGKNTVETYIVPDNTTVYLAIAPGTYTNFTAAKSNMDDVGTWYSKTKASVTFAAGKIYDLGTTSSWMPQPAPSYPLLSAVTTSDYGKVVCAAGHLHDAKTAVPVGCTAVGIIGKVTETGHGLILALQNATNQNWNTINGWTSETTYAGTTLKVLPDDAARGSLTSYTTLGETTVSNWAVAQKSDYEAIFTNLGSTTGDSDGKVYDTNVNAYITTGVGGTAISSSGWSATGNTVDHAWRFASSYWLSRDKTQSHSVRPVLGF